MVSSNSSLSYSEIMNAASPSQTLFFQFYKNAKDSVAEKRVWEIDSLGYKAIFLTVDAIVVGNRERDIRNPWQLEDEEKGAPTYWSESDDLEEVDGMGTAGAFIANDDRNMTWERVCHKAILSTSYDIEHQTIPWLRRLTSLPIVIKGKWARFMIPRIVLTITRHSMCRGKTHLSQLSGFSFCPITGCSSCSRCRS